MRRRNEEVATLLNNIAELLALKGESPFRVRAYAEAARSVGALSEDIDEIYHRSALEEIPGVGPSIAAKIADYLESGHSSYYDQLKREVPAAAVDLLEVPGIGPSRARLLAERLGVTTVPQLERAAREHRLRDLPGFGPALEEKIAREAARLRERTRRILLGVALPLAEEVVVELRSHPAVEAIAPTGSIRRMKETIGDIDVLVAAREREPVVERFTTLPLVKEVLAKGPTRPSILTRDDLQVDLRVVAPEEYGAALQYFTGSKEHNIALRALAIERGWKLSEYGLFDRVGRRIAGRTEEEVYQTLGLDWVPPELRE
ncbi:MAG: DNA polymerase III, partial [Thermomicrobiaceae bacterium]|nr:DNA polymerase III [Thermomicrobiaceae bacterium]